MNEVEKFKILDRSVISTFLKEYLIIFPGFSGFTFDEAAGINAVVFLSETPDELLTEINSRLGSSINDFIENKLNENCKVYNRSIIYYESEVQHSSLILRWI